MDCFELIKAIAEILLALVAIVISIIALKQTRTQIVLSNKQQLMDRRLDNYSLVSGLIENYSSVREKIDFDNLDNTLENVLRSLQYRTELLVMGMFSTPKDSVAFLNDINIRMAKLHRTSKELPIIFKNDDVKVIASFLENLSSFLLCGITYTVYLKFPIDKRKDVESDMIKAKDTLLRAYSETEKQFNQIETTNAVENLLKQIEL